MRYFLFLVFLFIQLQYLIAQEINVSNVSVSQEGNWIIVNYKLRTNSFISLIVLEDGKEKFGFRLVGDLGYVEAGDSKKITIVPETEILTCEGCIFRVISDDFEAGSVKIGKQIWQSKNLNVSVFANGDKIVEAKSANEWKRAGNLKQPAWCYYNYDPENGEKYGKLYNWYALNDPRKLAPDGWHVPSDEEWSILINNLGGETVAGQKMRVSVGLKKVDNATNSSGFSALPGGYCSGDGSFSRIGNYAYWWSSTLNLNFGAWYRFLFFNVAFADRSNLGKESGLSIRCVKD